MAYDERLASRVRAVLAEYDISERKMFGGLAFLLDGNMCCGIIGDRLMVRVGPNAYETALARPHCAPMDFNGKPMRGMVYVEPAGLTSKASLSRWVRDGVAFASSLAAK